MSPLVGHLETPIGLENLVNTPLDHFELDVVYTGCRDGIHVIVDIGVIGVVGIAVPVLEKKLHRIDFNEVIQIQHLVRSGQSIRLDMIVGKLQIGLVLEFGKRLRSR